MQTDYKITYNTTVNAPIEKVWDALINPEIVKQYFFGTELIANWAVGNDIIFKGEWEGEQYQDKGEILTFVPNKELSYSYL
ncbi:MAG: SRPBCC domain-containing protein, partial [Bacteroidia bacterium]|nr:SRPBCC domain-containing protein [Bacteroidia bacterium]